MFRIAVNEIDPRLEAKARSGRTLVRFKSKLILKKRKARKGRMFQSLDPSRQKLTLHHTSNFFFNFWSWLFSLVDFFEITLKLNFIVKQWIENCTFQDVSKLYCFYCSKLHWIEIGKNLMIFFETKFKFFNRTVYYRAQSKFLVIHESKIFL